jgi:hypothetical protein
VNWKWVLYMVIYTHCTYICSQPCLIFKELHCNCMWQLLYNYCKCAIKAITMLQLLYNVHTCDHMSQPHFGPSVRMKLTLPKVGMSQPLFGQVWGWNSHSQSWGLGVLRDSWTFRARQQGSKHLALRCSLYQWKALEV